jgi:raffinose synthase
MTTTSPAALEFKLPAGLIADRVGQGLILLSGQREEEFRSAEWGALEIPDLKQFLSLSLHSHFVMSPTFGNELSTIPDRCQFLLWETRDGQFGVLLPLLEEDFRAEAAGMSGGLKLKCGCGEAGRARSNVVLAMVCLRKDPYQAIQDGISHAVKWMGRGKLREEKVTPAWIDELGWCTWDAFYAEVDEAKILEGLSGFQQAGIMPGQIIIDEGWQDYSATNYLLSLEVKAGAFSHDRLETIVQRAKKEFGVQMVGCWRTLFGELRGVDVASDGLAQFRRRLVHEPGTQADTFGVIEPEDVPIFHDEYGARLAADGVDFVKVDFQSALPLMTYEQCGRAEAARIWQHSLQDSAEKHFHGEMLNCMAMGSDQVYHTSRSNVCRSSDDFFPTKDDSHPAHIRQNLYNALWLSQMQWPDWDMFHSKHPWAWYHAIGRAISGGPVYVSDKPGQNDSALLKKFIAADGRVLRCQQPALPTRDSLFADPVGKRCLIKAFNRCGEIGLLAVFHPDPSPESPAVEEEIVTDQIEGFGSEPCAVYSLNDGFLGVRSSLSRKLAFRDADLLVFSPVFEGFAAIGLIEKMNPPGAIVSWEFKSDRLAIEARGGGQFGVYADRPIREVLLNEVAKPFQYERSLVTFDTGNSAACRIVIRRD